MLQKIASKVTSTMSRFDKNNFKGLMDRGEFNDAINYCKSCGKHDISDAIQAGNWKKSADLAGLRSGYGGRRWRRRYNYITPYTYGYGGRTNYYTSAGYYNPYSINAYVGHTGYYPYRPGFHLSAPLHTPYRRGYGGYRY